MIKAVFFDLYNTLAGFSPPREQVQAQAARDFGFDLEAMGILRGYVEADNFMTKQNGIRHVARLSEGEQQRFFAEYERLILEGAGAHISAKLAGEIWRRVREIPYHLALFDDALPTLEAVKGRGKITGLISNISQDLVPLCERLGIKRHLDFIVTSHTAGSEKPHPKIFLKALEDAGVDPHEAIHIGDQYHGDIVGARAVGIYPILVDRDGLLEGYDDVAHIARLDEVMRFL